MSLVSYGVLLLVLALALFASESFVPSYGALSLGGIVALGAGVWLLAEGGVSRDVWVVAAAVGGVLFAFALVAAWKAGQAQRRPAAVGLEHLIGLSGQAREPLSISTAGWVMVDGALWQAVSDAPIAAGARVRVVATLPEMALVVEPSREAL